MFNIQNSDRTALLLEIDQICPDVNSDENEINTENRRENGTMSFHFVVKVDSGK